MPDAGLMAPLSVAVVASAPAIRCLPADVSARKRGLPRSPAIHATDGRRPSRFCKRPDARQPFLSSEARASPRRPGADPAPANRRSGDPREQQSATAESHCWTGGLALDRLAPRPRSCRAGSPARHSLRSPCDWRSTGRFQRRVGGVQIPHPRRPIGQPPPPTPSRTPSQAREHDRSPPVLRTTPSSPVTCSSRRSPTARSAR